MIRILTILLILSLCKIYDASAQFPTDSVEISILTASPGEETYAAFGHSAIRLHDKATGMDIAYNYGMFDFDTPNFYIKFGTGKLMYFLAPVYYQHFLQNYQESGQAMYEQKLNLTNREKYKLVRNLEINYQPENRFYRYNFTRDNCATRIRDIVENSVDGRVEYNSAYLIKNKSFRGLMHPYTTSTPWINFGLNLIMGADADSVAKLREYAFLPTNLKNQFATAKIISGDTVRNLSAAPIELFPATIAFPEPSPATLPVTVFWVIFLLILGITAWEFKVNRYIRLLDVFLFLVTGLIGLLITWLWTSSLHLTLHNNWNILWANPLNMIITIGLNIGPKRRWVRYLSLTYAVLLVLFILLSFIISQEFSSAIYPIVALMLVRSLRIWKL